VKTLWIELENEIDGVNSLTECVVDFVCLNLKKVEDTFWKDNYGKIKGDFYL